MVALLLVFVFLLTHGSTAEEAKQRAAARVGPGYQFHVLSMSISAGSGGKSVKATVAAYNDNEIEKVKIAWSE